MKSLGPHTSWPAPSTPTKFTACHDATAPDDRFGSVGTRGLRRRGSVPSAHMPCHTPYSDDLLQTPYFRCLTSDALLQMPWKILIPHSTTTMADTKVAAVNTL